MTTFISCAPAGTLVIVHVISVSVTVAGIQFSPPIVTSVLAILLENPVPVMVKVVDDPSIVIGVMPDIFGVSAGS
jgi:hypothetical protein